MHILLCEKALGAIVSQTSQHDTDHGEVDPSCFTAREQFKILGQSAKGARARRTFVRQSIPK